VCTKIGRVGVRVMKRGVRKKTDQKEKGVLKEECGIKLIKKREEWEN